MTSLKKLVLVASAAAALGYAAHVVVSQSPQEEPMYLPLDNWRSDSVEIHLEPKVSLDPDLEGLWNHLSKYQWHESILEKKYLLSGANESLSQFEAEMDIEKRGSRFYITYVQLASSSFLPKDTPDNFTSLSAVIDNLTCKPGDTDFDKGVKMFTSHKLATLFYGLYYTNGRQILEAQLKSHNPLIFEFPLPLTISKLVDTAYNCAPNNYKTLYGTLSRELIPADDNPSRPTPLPKS